MPIVRRIYVSLPADPWLPDNLNRLKWGIVEGDREAGLHCGDLHESARKARARLR
jgi:hypothetical protein